MNSKLFLFKNDLEPHAKKKRLKERKEKKKRKKKKSKVTSIENKK